MEVTRDEQYAAIKFCFCLRKTATETLVLLQEAYGESALPCSTVFRWFVEFKEGRQSTSKQGGPGPPVTAVTEVMVNTAAAIVREDRRITSRQLAGALGLSKGSIHTILHDHLHMTRVCARWIPRLLTPEQKQVRVDVCEELQRRFVNEGDAFLQSIITADESWLHHYDPETKQASTQWKSPGSPTPKKAKVTPSAGKVMVISFFDFHGMVYQHEVPRHTTVTAEYYLSVLKTLKQHIRKKRPALHLNHWRLHHDNACPHVSNLITEYLAQQQITCLPHPPYSPDLAPCDFFLFPTLKSHMRGERFTNSAAVIKRAEAVLKCITKGGLQHVFEEWKRRLAKCIAMKGEYFEKDHVDLDDE